MSCKCGPIVESCTLNVPLSALVQANWQFGAFIGLALRGGMKWFHMHVEASFGCVVLHTAFPPAGWVRALASSLRSGCWHVVRDCAVRTAASESGVCGLSARRGAVKEIKESRWSLWSRWKWSFQCLMAALSEGKQGFCCSTLVFYLLHLVGFKWIIDVIQSDWWPFFL